MRGRSTNRRKEVSRFGVLLWIGFIKMEIRRVRCLRDYVMCDVERNVVNLCWWTTRARNLLSTEHVPNRPRPLRTELIRLSIQEYRQLPRPWKCTDKAQFCEAGCETQGTSDVINHARYIYKADSSASK